MLIAHISIPADDCRQTARILAEIMQGRAYRFPPGGPEAYMAWSKNAEIEIEVTPRGAFMVAGQDEVEWESGPTRRSAECHAAICIDRPVTEIMEITERADWRARICDRGGFFHVVEVWVENAFLIEFLDPAFTAEYRNAMTFQNWERVFGVAAA